jgi:hypothetical protein
MTPLLCNVPALAAVHSHSRLSTFVKKRPSTTHFFYLPSNYNINSFPCNIVFHLSLSELWGEMILENSFGNEVFIDYILLFDVPNSKCILFGRLRQGPQTNARTFLHAASQRDRPVIDNVFYVVKGRG